MEVVTVKPNKPVVGKAFKAKAKEVQAALENLGEDDALCLKVTISRPCPYYFIYQWAAVGVERVGSLSETQHTMLWWQVLTGVESAG